MFRTKHSTWKPEWSPMEHEIFRDFGYAAFAAQMLESSLVQILLAMELKGRISVEKKGKKKRDMETELFLSEQTLGVLIRELKRAGMDKHTEEMLDDALKARNFLMHHFFVKYAGDFATEHGRGKMLKELQSLRFRIGRVQYAFSQVRQQLYEKYFGITADKWKKRYDAYLKSRQI